MKEIYHRTTKKARAKYKFPVQAYTNQEVKNVKLFCQQKGCVVYKSGTLGYNGLFICDDGHHTDLRESCFWCSKHWKKEELRRAAEAI
jgi:hypothetical protein